ncbi:MAG: DUF305 domain-containing protein [Gammaproteobacteria bacterium]|nr:DUF305 domain-containing protein [Gammaproteobacteria bacterium]
MPEINCAHGPAMLRAAVAIALLTAAASTFAQPPIVQPGAPGQPSRTISADDAIRVARLQYSAADIRFMQDMIPHHQQALEMSELVAERTQRPELIDLARRIDASQRDEIAFMEDWLRQRDLPLPDPHAHHHAHHAHHHDHADEHAHAHGHTMVGMATPEQMAELAASQGEAFDRLFLELMIEHHRGALVMVEELLEQPGSASDPTLFEFTTEVTNDQQTEIDRMTVLLASYSPDPRVGLSAGIFDAGEAIHNMSLLVALPKPPGFFDPENPGGLSPARLRALAAAGEVNGAGPDPEPAEADAADASPESEPRSSPLDFANTDIAFAGDLLVVGSYHGFKLYDIANQGIPELLSAVVCPGGQGDVSVVGDLLIMSVEQVRGRLDCGLEGTVGKVSDERFRGLRIFDISDPVTPRQVGAVQTCRGSHTHTVVPGATDDGTIIVYNSGTSFVRDDEELEGCSDESPWRDEQTALFRIDVIEIPVDRPQDARIVASPAVFADPESGILAGLWERGDHGPGTQTTAETNHCHDITVYPELGIAAGACSGNGILFDISDPLDPQRIDAVVDPGFAYWHSATFNNDATRVIFTDEWGGGTRPRCRAADPMTWGANAIYDIVDNRLEFRGYYKLPAPQTEQENCVAHNGSLVPVPGRDIYVQAWYQGGITVFDFTDPANPFEIAFFDRGPVDEEELIVGGYWSAYWYRGLVYGTEIVRGVDVLALTPSEYLSANEIAAASLYEADAVFNPQTQLRVQWPAEPVVARAYLDQLQRDGRSDAETLAQLDGLLSRVEQRLSHGQRDRALAGELRSLARQFARDATEREGAARTRLQGLSETLEGLADRLRGRG